MSFQLKTVQTKDGLSITYADLKAALDVQEEEFAAKGLHIPSPAEKAYLMMHFEEKLFLGWSRTNMDVFYDDRDGRRVILAKRSPISQLFLSDMVNAHSQKREFTIPNDKREQVYSKIDTMLGDGSAFSTSHGHHAINTMRFGKSELTEFIFSDPSLGINAADYGKWLQNTHGRDKQFIWFDEIEHASGRGPFLKRLEFMDNKSGFLLGAYATPSSLPNNALGVSFEKNA